MASQARSFTRRDTVLLGSCVALSILARALPERMRDPLAAALRQSLVAPLIALQNDAELTRRAWLARDAIILARDSAALRAMLTPVLQRENGELRQLLGMAQRLRWGFVPAEVLHGRNAGEDYTVMLSAGSRTGVQPFSPVVGNEGLVGMVKTVDPTMSIAIFSSHPDFRVSAMASDGSAFGIVAAHLGTGADRYLLELRGVPVRSSLKPGTVIWSSGFGGVYPRGIPIGTVIGEDRKPAEGWARTYLLRPAVVPASVDAVMILRRDQRPGGVEGVWAAPQSVDSAAKRIATVVDSAARSSGAGLATTRNDSVPRRRKVAPVRLDTPVARPDSLLRPDSVRADTTRPPPP
ncbi:MAG: rod shape-determining protein MreC [Anaerolineae bacterium]|nr:rod shape-determining protein MreC [Gemmatimonadaceae bacterium]